jgi:hypothetical protein
MVQQHWQELNHAAALGWTMPQALLQVRTCRRRPALRSQIMQLPSELALTHSSSVLALTTMQFTGPLWSFMDASMV